MSLCCFPTDSVFHEEKSHVLPITYYSCPLFAGAIIHSLQLFSDTRS